MYFCFRAISLSSLFFLLGCISQAHSRYPSSLLLITGVLSFHFSARELDALYTATIQSSLQQSLLILPGLCLPICDSVRERGVTRNLDFDDGAVLIVTLGGSHENCDLSPEFNLDLSVLMQFSCIENYTGAQTSVQLILFLVLQL